MGVAQLSGEMAFVSEVNRSIPSVGLCGEPGEMHCGAASFQGQVILQLVYDLWYPKLLLFLSSWSEGFNLCRLLPYQNSG